MKTVIKYEAGQWVLTIPAEVAAQAAIGADSEVELTVDHGKIVIRPAGTPHYSLADLVAQITDDNRHELIDWGPPVGREVW